MIDIKKYINDPCNSLSMPYWKAKKTSVRSDTMIIHNNQYDEVLFRDWQDTKYYRLKHDLLNLSSKKINNHFFYETLNEDNINNFISVMNQSNLDDEVTMDDIKNLMREDTFCADLWILVYYKKIYHKLKEPKIVYDEYGKKTKITKEYLPVGLIISNFDQITKEVSIEQLNVIPAYQKFDLAEPLIRESLLRISCIADFATVTDKFDSEVDHYSLYKNAGFAHEAIWHVLKKNN